MRIIYSEERVGRGGRSFNIYKIKTLKDKKNGEAVDFEEEKEMIMSGFHRMLRKYGLDEIPQIVNILLGDMNLFGTRPLTFREYKLYSEVAKNCYISFRPGIIGDAAIEGRIRKKHDFENEGESKAYARKVFIRLWNRKMHQGLTKKIIWRVFLVRESFFQVLGGHDKNI